MSTLPIPAKGTSYPTKPTAAHVATMQAAFSGTAPTERQIHNILATAPGGGLSDMDFVAYATTTYQTGPFKGRVLSGDFGS